MAQTVIAADPPVTPEDEFTVGLDDQGRVRISPTDVSQFIRLDQCERYLRLQLHERSAGTRFLYDYGVVPQSIPFLLTQSGRRFEEGVERVVAGRFHNLNLAEGGNRASTLSAGQCHQPSASPGACRAIGRRRLLTSGQ